ncbi:MAG: hypothetical protein J0I20_33960 [Chloroflexi bacterium]|nr:hypothetical protein [Chloroflexota bacterium]OJW05600.1 MAG: hypothetical protein BGO39_03005 [Chloroflexi bacterium 54-19]
MNLLFTHYDIFTDLLTPDKNAILSFIYGLVSGWLGTFIRNSLIPSSKPGVKKESLTHYFGWSSFGALVALSINSQPIVSIIIGFGAPSFFKGMQDMTPGLVEFIKAKLPQGNTNTKKD